jgi:hypothetical protein
MSSFSSESILECDDVATTFDIEYSIIASNSRSPIEFSQRNVQCAMTGEQLQHAMEVAFDSACPMASRCARGAQPTAIVQFAVDITNNSGARVVLLRKHTEGQRGPEQFVETFQRCVQNVLANFTAMAIVMEKNV